jgi:LuxR family maltose regulon positive regulatory protein
MTLAAALTWQGRLDEAEAWLRRAERTVRAEAEPGTRMGVHHVRGVLELARGRLSDARAAFEAAERLTGLLGGPHLLVTWVRAMLLHTLVRLGETGLAEQVLAGLGEKERERGEIRIITAMLRLARDDPQAAMAALIPVLDGSASLDWPTVLIQACLLEAIARDALGDPAAAGRALERALDLTEVSGALLWFLLHPAPGLLERHARQRTAHGALLADILSLLAGQRPAPSAAPRPPLEALSDSEIRVLRYLPTNLTGPEIARELYVSVNTVKSHLRSLYAKLGTHHRAETVALARALGLLAPSPLRAQATLPD